MAQCLHSTGMESHHAAHKFNYLGWQVLVQLDGLSDDGRIKAHAEARFGSRPASHFKLQGEHRNSGGAIAELAQTARTYIDNAA